jgi:hypothetical protein
MIACDVTLSIYSHRASLKNMPDHGGNRTYDLWNTLDNLCYHNEFHKFSEEIVAIFPISHNGILLLQNNPTKYFICYIIAKYISSDCGN